MSIKNNRHVLETHPVIGLIRLAQLTCILHSCSLSSMAKIMNSRKKSTFSLELRFLLNTQSNYNKHNSFDNEGDHQVTLFFPSY